MRIAIQSGMKERMALVAKGGASINWIGLSHSVKLRLKADLDQRYVPDQALKNECFFFPDIRVIPGNIGSDGGGENGQWSR